MRIAEIPLAQSGLLAVALNFTGEPYCPLIGDVTVTRGVVAKTGIVSPTDPHRTIDRQSAGERPFMGYLKESPE
jgi:hypothetical protein